MKMNNSVKDKKVMNMKRCKMVKCMRILLMEMRHKMKMEYCNVMCNCKYYSGCCTE